MSHFFLILAFTVLLVGIVTMLVRRDRRKRDLDRRVLLRAIAQITVDRERRAPLDSAHDSVL